MDQPKTDKFAELSPVLELVYVMLTNMAKYIDVYATDIEAGKLEQYIEAKDALKTAIAKFDVLYGLQSTATAAIAAETQPAPTETIPDAETPANKDDANLAYDFAAGNDPESLKKAQQAVEELKTLFADMKKQDAEASAAQPVPAAETVPAPMPAPVEEVAPSVNPNTPMPTFVTPPASTTEPQAGVQLPTPMNTQAAEQDASEIDSILSELKKLQSKGTQQL